MPIEPGSGASGLSRVYIEGDLLFDDMLRDIECAQRSVRFESYIFTSDPVGRQFVDTLARCATRNPCLRSPYRVAGGRRAPRSFGRGGSHRYPGMPHVAEQPGGAVGLSQA